jgi:hypothetical protein
VAITSPSERSMQLNLRVANKGTISTGSKIAKNIARRGPGLHRLRCEGVGRFRLDGADPGSVIGRSGSDVAGAFEIGGPFSPAELTQNPAPPLPPPPPLPDELPPDVVCEPLDEPPPLEPHAAAVTPNMATSPTAASRGVILR